MLLLNILRNICKRFDLLILKGTVSRDFRHFFIKKLHLGGPFEQAKMVSRNFFVFAEDFREKRLFT